MSDSKTLDLDQWAKITIQRWQYRIAKLKIHNPDRTEGIHLIESFRHHVEKDANGDSAKVQFVFNHYGWYVDAGAGMYPHRPKKWYNRIFWREFNIMIRLLQEQYGENVVKTIENSME